MHTKINLRASRLGRLIARLSGEEKGAVMMEYVVLAVLLVAAVVGAVMYFSQRMNRSLKAAGEAAGGKTSAAATTVENANKAFDTDMKKALENQQAIQGNEMSKQSAQKP